MAGALYASTSATRVLLIHAQLVRWARLGVVTGYQRPRGPSLVLASDTY